MFFLTSLKDEFRTLQNIDPQYPKHTSMAELELKFESDFDRFSNPLLEFPDDIQ